MRRPVLTLVRGALRRAGRRSHVAATGRVLTFRAPRLAGATIAAEDGSTLGSALDRAVAGPGRVARRWHAVVGVLRADTAQVLVLYTGGAAARGRG